MRQLLLDLTQAPAPTFANFVHGGNVELVHALEAAAAGRSAEHVFYIWGESASGKTHLLKALVDALGPGVARYVRGEAFAPEGLPPVVALDDIEGLSEDRQIALFNAFNEGAFRLIVAAATTAPRDVPLRRDLATRLATGLTYRVLPLTDAEKGAALAAHAHARGFALTDEVTAYLLTHARRDMGSLMATLDALDRYSLETGRAITVPLIKAAMQPELPMGRP